MENPTTSKDKKKTEDTKGVVYQLDCNDFNLGYIGETKRTVKKQIKEHCAGARNGRREVSAAAEHVIKPNHAINWINHRLQRATNRRPAEIYAKHLLFTSEKNALWTETLVLSKAS